MRGEGRIGTNGRDDSGGFSSSKMSASRLIGFYGSGMKGMARPRKFRSAYARRRYAKMVGLLLVCAAVVTVVSAVALLPSGQAALAEKALSRPPGFPYTVFGYTYQSDGVTPWPYCDVLITNKNTTEFNTTVSDDSGYYSIDLNNPLLFPSVFTNGDIVNVTATNGTSVGWNEGTADDTGVPVLWLDVTLRDVAIPEFSTVILPVVGLMALVAVVSLRRRVGKP